MSVPPSSGAPLRGLTLAVAASVGLLAWSGWPAAPSSEPIAPLASLAPLTQPIDAQVAASIPVTVAEASLDLDGLRPVSAAPSALDIAVGPEPLATLDAKAAKQAKKAAKVAQNANKKLAKLEAQELTYEAKLADVAEQLAELEAQRPAALEAVEDAEAELAAADAMPKSTKPEKIAWKLALKAAKKALSVANKQLKTIDKGLAKYGAWEEKFELVADILDEKIELAQEVADDAAADFDSLIETFDFDSLETYSVSLTVVDELGDPVAFAPVQIKEVLIPPKNPKTALEDVTPAGHYLRALTDAAGEVEALLEVPGYTTEIDLLIVAPGYTGAYTHEALRDTWGPFAPATRQVVDPDELDGLAVVLTTVEG